jgi:LacI family transcriptional regulator
VPTTIQDVARLAGVSIATVSRVLNRSAHPVRSEVRERVEAAARELDFRPSALARGLAGRETRMLALVLPDVSNPYYPRLLRGAEDAASAEGYALIVCNTDYDPAKVALYVKLLREKHVDGVLVGGGGHDQPADLVQLVDAGVPIQAIGRHALAVASVRIDNLAAGRAATRHLLERGCSRVAFVGGSFTHTTVADRRAGYRQALREAGMDREAQFELEADFTPAGGAEAGRRLLGLSPCPDGVFAANDHLAVGLLHALQAAGRRIPQDVAVIGFDDIPLAQFLRPALSSVAVPAYELGAQAVQRLMRQMRGEQVPDTAWLETRVVARESTAREV